MRMKILIVEDEILLAMDIQVELASMGHDAIGIAVSSDIALAILDRESPDLVLMDIVIQGRMNGIELADVIAEKYPRCKVLYITAHSDEATIARAKKTKHEGIINKPFEAYQLKEAIKRAS